ncbi:lachrymatory-factor synthase [Phtheirospermum japonicum]|uniref:Lachrymatory-factor synthase n=1 Tax=Phtheirospermum japonicum TaxID=374723 RepID=A0A830B7A6_9LAMI|nr:lachrymatory-factor synthase [Phtheirospermum japonicum]
MASELGNEPKWEGKATAELHKPTADQVWPLLEDFFGLHKWLPSLDTCRQVEGSVGQLRYCATTLPPPPEGGKGVVKWCHEKLLDIDPIDKWLSYEILDNNMGFKDYKSTIKVLPIKGGGDMKSGCMIEWTFLADPVEGLSYEDLVKYFDFSLQGMAQNMERALETN